MKTKTKKSKVIYSETYVKGAVPINFTMLEKLIGENKLNGYVIKSGDLDDGSQFSEMYFVIKQDKK